MAFDPELVLPDAESFAGRRGHRAVEGRNARPPCENTKTTCGRFSPRPASAGTRRWKNSPPKLREQLLHGTGKRFAGVLGMLEKEYATTISEPKRQRLEAFRGEVVCKECGGTRLRPEARSVRVAGQAIHEVTALTVAAARQFFEG